MARPKNKIPSYLHHHASGQARVRINGRDVYLGPIGPNASKQAYARVIAENFGNGSAPTITIRDGEKLSIAALIVKYDDFAQAYRSRYHPSTGRCGPRWGFGLVDHLKLEPDAMRVACPCSTEAR